MSNIFHKITEDEIFDLIASDEELKSNIIISNIDEELMERIICELRKQELNKSNFLINLSPTEIDHITYLMWFIPYMYLHTKREKSGANETSEIEKSESKKKEIEEKENELRLAECETRKSKSFAKERKNKIRSLHAKLYDFMLNPFKNNREDIETLMEKILEQEKLLKLDNDRVTESIEEENKLKAIIKEMKLQVKILETLIKNRESVLISYIVEAYFIGKLLKRFSVDSKLFQMLKINEYTKKSENYENLINSKNYDYTSILKSLLEKKVFSWQTDVVIPFGRVKGMKVVNWIPNFQNLQSPKSYSLVGNVHNIINKSTEAMRFIILTSVSAKETHELFASFGDPCYTNPKDEINGYKEFSLVRVPKK